MQASDPFGIFFVGHSVPIPASQFQQVDATHWVLDVGGKINVDFQSLKEVALFLQQPLAAGIALGLYVQLGGAGWSYRGFVSNDHPSDVLPLQWPIPESNTPNLVAVPGHVQIGVSLEPYEELVQKEGGKLKAKETFAKAVALNLFHFMESFGGVGQQANQLVVPTDCIDRWFMKFSQRFRRDPDFLTRERNELGS